MKEIFTNISQVMKKYFPETKKEKEEKLLKLPPEELGKKLAMRVLRNINKKGVR